METDISILVLVAFAGAIGELVDAAVGMGFGVLTSSLMVAGGVAPGVAATTVNLAKVGSGAFSGAAHWRFGNIRWQWFLPLLLPGLAGAVSGALLLTHLSREIVRILVPCVLLWLSLFFLRQALFPSIAAQPLRGGSQVTLDALGMRRTTRLQEAVVSRLPRFLMTGIGFLAGLVNAMTGGYGPFATSTLLLIKGGHPRFAVGTANMVEIFVAGAGAATLLMTTASQGFRWEVAAALIFGSFFTAPLGAYLARRMSPRPLMALVGLTLLGINTWSIVRALT